MTHRTPQNLLVPTIAALLALGEVGTVRAEPNAQTPDIIKEAFGNTIVTTYPDGKTQLLWLHADGTYAAKGRRRTDSSGAWTIKGPKMCLKQQHPFPAPFSYCTPIPASDRWQAKALDGQQVQLKVVRGIVPS